MLSVNWKKTIVVVLDVIVAVYLLMAVTAFNRPEDKATVCTKVCIDISGETDGGFLTTNGVKQLLEKEHLYPLASPMQFVSTRQIEEALAKNPFVESAECYKTQYGHVCIDLVQRLPVVHVMNGAGEEYYLDSQGRILPHVNAADLPVATGNITRSYAQKVLAPMAKTILADKFWNSQVEQINILADGTVELVPRVGDHIIFLGAPRDVESKLERLRKFYKYGLSHAGWNRYKRISVEFSNQIICQRHEKYVKRKS
jgi:cell division protein FtsQ